MSEPRHRFYMIRMEGGEWEPRRRHSSLKKTMEIAYEMAAHHKKPATILQTISSVEIVDGKPVWADKTPER